MHPENIRKIIGSSEAARIFREKRLAEGDSEHSIDQLISAWATILFLWDNSPDARDKLGG